MTRLTRIHSMMDLSDGLSTDLNRICTQSRVGALIEAAKVPISDAARQSTDPLAAALNDGEDFELLFTIAPDQWQKLHPLSELDRVGKVTDSGRMELQQSDGRIVPLEPKGFDHL